MNRTKSTLLACAALLLLAGAALNSQFAKLTQPATARAAAPEPVVQGCTGVTVTDIVNENTAASTLEKVTVNWNFTPPPGVGNSCIGVEGFKVHIVVTRRNGKTDERNIDTTASARNTSVTFTEAGNKIKTINATVTAKFSGAATNSKTENSDN